MSTYTAQHFDLYDELDELDDEKRNPKPITKKNKNRDGKKIIFDNCEIFISDGTSIGTCSKKRIDWYIKKGLAKKLSDTSIELLFKPNIKNEKSKNIKIHAIRKNICYVCGDENVGLMSFHTFPHAFKRFLPIDWKQHNSSDALSLCKECTYDANQVANEYKIILEEKYNVSKNDFIDKEKRELKD